MTVILQTTVKHFVGDTADTKPTGVPVGSTYLDRQTSILYVTYDGTNWAAKDTLVRLLASSVNIGDVDVVSLPSGNLGQQAKAASVSVAPATDITDATYIGDIKFGEALPAGAAVIGKVDSAASTPTLYSVTMTNANTEYSQALPANCRRFTWQCRTAYDVRAAYVTGKVATSVEPFLTLKAARAYDSGPIAQGASPSTLYVACSTAGQVIEIEAWT